MIALRHSPVKRGASIFLWTLVSGRTTQQDTGSEGRPGSVIFFPTNAPARAILNCLIWWVIVND